MPPTRDPRRPSRPSPSPPSRRRRGGDHRGRVGVERLEARTVPSTVVLYPVADGLVADRNLDLAYDFADTTSTSISDRWFTADYAPGVGQERGVFEFDLSGVAPGTPVVSATLGLTVVSFTTSGTSNPQVNFEAARGTGTVTAADGSSAGAAAGSATVGALGTQQFSLTPGALQSLEGGVAAVRLENAYLNSTFVQVSSRRDTGRPQPVLTLVLAPTSGPTSADDHYTVNQGGTLSANAAAAALPAPAVRYGFDEAASGNATAADTGTAPAAPGTFTGGATRTPSTPGFASAGALDLSTPGSDTVNAGHASVLDTNTAMTVTAWVNVRSASSNNGKMLVTDTTLGFNGTNGTGWDLQLTTPYETQPAGNTAVVFDVYSANGSGQGKISTSFTPTNRWVFVAATFDANRVVTLYEGDTAASVTQVGVSGSLSYGLGANSTPLIIGGSGVAPAAAAYTPPAWVDDVRVYGSALTAAQVDAVRAGNLPPGVLANDASPGGLALTASLVSGPAHGTLALKPDGSFTYTPTAGYFGPDGFTYQANNGTAAGNTASVTISVVAPPAAAADRYATAENAALAVAAGPGLLANDTDPNGLPLAATLQGAPAHGTVAVKPDGSFVYTPAANYYGLDSFTYTDTNSAVAGNAATVTVNVVAPPVANADTYSTARSTTLTVAPAAGVLANDTDPNGLPLTASLASNPAHGALAFNADGSFTYTPAAGYVGPDSFTYQATNGVAAGVTATVTLKVSPPSAADDTATVAENSSLTVAAPGVLGNDTDPNGLPLTASLVAGPAHGTLALNADGSYSYKPDAGYFGTDAFTYQDGDGVLTSNTATVTVTVSQAGSVSGTVWDDVNASGTRVASDPGLAGRTIFLDLNHDGKLDPGEPSAVTAADGSYAIRGVPPGTYSVTEVVPAGWAQTSPAFSAPKSVTVPFQTRTLVNFSDLASPYTRTLGSYQSGGYYFDATPSTSYAFVIYGPDNKTQYVGTTALSPQAGTNVMTIRRNDAVPFALQSVDVAPAYKNEAFGVTLTGTQVSGAQVSQSPAMASTVTLTRTALTALTNLTSLVWSSYYSGQAQFTNFVFVSGGPVDLTGVSFGQARASGAPPVASADAYTGVMGTTLSVSAAAGVLANDTDPLGDPVNAALVSGPTHGSLTLNADGSFAYTPAQGFYGPDSFTYKAVDGYLSSAAVTVALTFNRPPVAAADAYAVARNTTLTVAASSGVLANDRDWNGLPLAATVATNPAHGTLSLGANGSFTYTPAAGYTGADSFTYLAGDGPLASQAATVSLTVDPGPVAVADAYLVPALTPLTVSAAAGVLADDVSPGGSPLTAALVTGPTKGSVKLNADGSFTYTPPAYAYYGTDSFTYKANDGTFDSNPATVTLNVDAAPAVTADAYSVVAGSTLTTVPGVSALLINSQLGDSVGHGQYKALNTSTGWFWAARGQYQKNSVAISYNDFGYGEYTYPTTSEGWTLSFAAPFNALVTPGTYLNATRFPFQAVTAPGLDVSGDGSGANTSKGQFTVTQANYDGSGNVTSFDASFVQYGDNSTAPLTGRVQYQATGNRPGGVLLNDSDAAHLAMTASVVTGPSHGALAFNPDGTFSYTPAAGYTGTDGFTYTAGDGLLTSAPAAVTISVVAAPVAADDGYIVLRNTTLTVPAPGVLGNDTNPNGPPITAAVVSGPAHGALSFNPDGSFAYTPAAGYYGVDTFTYQDSLGGVAGNVGTVTLRVKAPTVAVNDAYTVGKNSSTTVPAPGVLGNDTDPNGDPFTATVVSSTPHGTLALQSGGGFTYIPAANYTGADSFTYQDNNGLFLSNVATVRLTVVVPPVAAADTYQAPQDATFTAPAPGVLANDTDAAGDPITAVLGSAATHGSLTLRADGSFSYTPAAGYVGADSFTYRASDNGALSAPATVTINVVATPAAAADSYNVAHDTPLTVAAPGVLGNDTSPTGSPLTASVVAGPAHGSLALNADGSFSYTPAAGYAGPDGFTYRANDGRYDSSAAAVTLNVAAAAAPADTPWVDDAPPPGSSTFVSSGAWAWGGSNPAPFSGALDYQTGNSAGQQMSYFVFPGPFAVAPGSRLGAYVYLDPTSPPSEIMFQWLDGSSWAHAAYWGANQISWGTNGGPDQYPAGALPAAGGWYRLDVPAAAVGLDGKGVTGLALTTFGGTTAFDDVGATHASTQASATFVAADATTQGGWKPAYGGDGYDIAQDPGGVSLPSYAQAVSLAGQYYFVWTPSTLDPRAPFKANSASDRAIGAWYSPASFTIDVPITDGASHRVALYALDPDGAAGGRSERFDLVDDATGLTLDTRSISGFQNGVYLVWNVTGGVTIRVTNTNPGAGSNAVVNGLFFGPAAATPTASATFASTDATTQGNWKPAYGGEGYDLAQDPGGGPSLPGYVSSVNVAGQYDFTWAGSTIDPRALLKSTSASDRVIGAWYSPTSFTIDVHMAPGSAHRIALYALDPDSAAGGRSQRFDLVDDATGLTLDTRSIASFQNGVYLVWNVTGSVTVRVTNTNPGAGSNAVVNGLFFGAAATSPASSAAFVATDATTQGNWKPAYGGEGYDLAQDPGGGPSLPGYVSSVNVAGQYDFTWAGSTIDPRALYKGSTVSDRVIGAWYSPTSFTIDVHMAPGAAHRIALYALDPDGAAGGRSERFDLVDDATGLTLDSRAISGFQNGVYLVWNVTGGVTIRVTNTSAAAGSNAVVNGLFFGAAAATPAASASFAGSDVSTQGNWKGVYGGDGNDLAQDPGGPSLPGYATAVAVAGQYDFTWAGSTADTRALQNPSSPTDRILAAWYSPASFTIDVHMAPGAAHRVALYALDPDGAAGGRTERFDLVDDATGLTLDSRAISGFQNGVYLVWNVTGGVTIRVTNANPGAGSNAVVNGLFLG